MNNLKIGRDNNAFELLSRKVQAQLKRAFLGHCLLLLFLTGNAVSKRKISQKKIGTGVTSKGLVMTYIESSRTEH